MEMNENKNSTEVAKQLIEAVKQQFEIENKRISEYRNEIYREKDFKVRKIYTYSGPNYYLNCQAIVFNIFIAPNGDTVNFFKKHIVKVFPEIEQKETLYVIDLFAETLLQVLKMDIDLYINKYAVYRQGDEYIISMEYLSKDIAIDAIYLVSDWFRMISKNKEFDFIKEFVQIQADFDKTLFGGPTLYSLVEAGLKADIPVFYLFEENQFQWGYGKKQLRGRSTTFHTDGIKDTEFTMFKDMVADFLIMCGFPTPIGKNCFDEEECLEEAKKLGFPVVVKPVAGHKGQGVTTGIKSEDEVRKAFQKIVLAAKAEGTTFDGAIVQQQIYGTDHRLLSVGGKFVAALERVPAYVDGNGKNTIAELIAEENAKEIRLDNARSPLCKIKIDDNLQEYLKLQNINLSSIPKENERITLRRVANISAGGVSINVTDKIHPDNIQLVEDIAGYFSVKCLGIDVLSSNISKSWKEGNFGIIEINAGPGVFMHLAPAYGGSINVPEKIMNSHFYKPNYGRIPIIATNNASQNFTNILNNKLHEIKNNIYFGCLINEGVFYNGRYFFKNEEHDKNVKIILRNPKLDIALFAHTSDDIFDFGLLHRGADIIILDEANDAEKITLKEQLLPDALLIIVENNQAKLFINDEEQDSRHFDNPEDKDWKLLNLLENHLNNLIYKYE